MKTLLTALLAMSSLVACGPKTLHGILTTYDDVSIRGSDDRMSTLNKGNFNLTAKVDSQNKEMLLKFEESTGLADLVLRLPKTLDLNKDMVSMNLSSTEINQPWNFQLTKYAETTLAPAKWGVESCYISNNYMNRDYFCDNSFYWPDNRWGGVNYIYGSCYYNYTGSRVVQFQDRTIQTKIKGHLLSPMKNKVLGVLYLNADPTNDRVYLYQGICK